MPLTINCWPSLSGGQSYVNIEYESTSAFDLHNVAITIPLPHNAPPAVNQVGMGGVGGRPCCFDLSHSAVEEGG